LATLPSPVAPSVTRVFGADEDSAVEEAFGLRSGQISARRRADSVCLRVDALDDENGLPGSQAILGFARFDPTSCLAFPFRVRRAVHLRPLLEAMKGYARLGEAATRLAVDDGADVRNALLASG